MGRSIFIIKPEAFLRKKEICKIIKNSGLKIISTKILTIDQYLVRKMYSSSPRAVIEGTVYQYGINKSLLGLVEGEDAILRLVAVCGEHMTPKQCKPGTIRRLFSFPHPIHLPNKKVLYLNAIHRTKTLDEYEEQLKIFKKFLL